jgi:uncharacterized Zn finger protein
MNWDWNDKPRAKRPPPRHGLKVRKLGATWWGQRWIEALERFSREYLNRLGRGRTYARAGRVHDLRFAPGEVRARVTGSSSAPYQVVLRLEPFDESIWETAIAAMGTRASFAAELLAGRMPENIDAVFRTDKRSLFPRSSQDLQTDCSCLDWANPCKHVAALHYVLGEALDKDPFLLFELRGRSKEQVLRALSRLRSGVNANTVEEGPPPEGPVAGVLVPVDAVANYESCATPLPAMRFTFDAPQPASAILRTVEAPTSWTLPHTPVESLEDCYARAATLARELALGAEESTPATPAHIRRARAKRPPRDKPPGAT